ncbi:hypothetical protein Vretifemale_6007 [Volvox reticuliferus]|nr:hypothetical protein Vretifemale_6007 [Volvox reticuliferus]
MGAMATCQSRGQGHGILTPLATNEELGLVLTLLGWGCCSQNNGTDEFIFVGLTTLGNAHSISFLDRPRPGSSTALLRNVSAPGQGFVNGSWPDDPSLTSAAATPASEISVIDATPIHPLCAAIRLHNSSTPSAGDPATAGAKAVTSQLQLAVCSDDAVRYLACSSSSKKVSYQLEVHFLDCDGGPMGQGGNGSSAAHAFVCRVPAPSHPPSPWPPQLPRSPSLPPTFPKTPLTPPPVLPSEQLPASTPETQPVAPANTQSPPASVNSDAKSQAQEMQLPDPVMAPLPTSPAARRQARGLWLRSCSHSSRSLLQTVLDTAAAPPSAPHAKAPPPVNNLSPRAPVAPMPGQPIGTVRAPPPSGGVPVVTNATMTLSAASVMPKCDTEILNVAGVAIHYLACHVTASWSESAQLCTQLLVGGTLAVFESQAQMDAVSTAFSKKDLGGFYDFWFGLVSGNNLEQPSGLRGPTLEYVLTDPRVIPTLPLQLWSTGGLVAHSSCQADPEPPLSSDPQAPPSDSTPVMPPWSLPTGALPHPPKPGAPAPPAENNLAPSPAWGPPTDPLSRLTPPKSAPGTSPPPDPASVSFPTTTPPPVRTPVTTPSPPIPSTALLPRASGCCASLAISSNLTSGTAGSGSVLRACYHKIKFICQAAQGTETAPTTAGPNADSGSGATTLLASLFLDALESSYKGSYRVFSAKLDLRLIGAPYSSLSQPDGNPIVEGFRSETARQLSQATALPTWSFTVLDLRNGSVVATLNLTVRGLRRATLDNFTEFVSTSLVGKTPAELFSRDFIETWSIQGCVVTILGLWEIGDPLLPAPPGRSSSSKVLILIVAVVGGIVLGATALGLILLVLRRRKKRNGTPVYLTYLEDVDQPPHKKNQTALLSSQLPQLPPQAPQAPGSASQDVLIRHPTSKPFSRESSSSLLRITGLSPPAQVQQQAFLQFSPSDRMRNNGVPRQQQQQQQQQQQEEATGFRSHAVSEAGFRTQGLDAGTGSGSMGGALYNMDDVSKSGNISGNGRISGRFNLTPSRSIGGRSEAGPSSIWGRGLQPGVLDGFGLGSSPVAATTSGGGSAGGGFLSDPYDDASMPNSPTMPRTASRLQRNNAPLDLDRYADE